MIFMTNMNYFPTHH